MKLAGVVMCAAFALGCPQEPRERPDVACSDACAKRISKCTEHDCERGCAFVLDRLVEHQQDPVLECVEHASTCGDTSWAECGARIGAHSDGGPGVPPSVPPAY